MKFVKKPVIIDAITFDEFVRYGKDNGGNIVNDMPWSFQYAGYPVTHENDDCYLVLDGKDTIRFNRGDVLCIGDPGVYVCDKDIFEATYEAV